MDECENLVINLEDAVETYEELANDNANANDNDADSIDIDGLLQQQQEEIINDNDAEVIQLTQALTEGDIMVNGTWKFLKGLQLKEMPEGILVHMYYVFLNQFQAQRQHITLVYTYFSFTHVPHLFLWNMRAL